MGGENFGWLELMLGAVSGAFTMLLMSLLFGVISARSRKNKEKQKELIGKAVAHMMGKVNELFIAYRLGDLAFEQMERESREYISKITDDINDNNGQLSSAYVAVVTRYIEEKTEMLIAIKEDFHQYNIALQQETVGHINAQAATQVPVHPTTHDAPAANPMFASAQEQQAPIGEIPVKDELFAAAQPPVEQTAPVFAQSDTGSLTQQSALESNQSFETAETVQEIVEEPVADMTSQNETPVLDLSDTFAPAEETSTFVEQAATAENQFADIPSADTSVHTNVETSIIETAQEEDSEDLFNISINEEPAVEASNPISDIAMSVENEDSGAAQPQVTGNNPFGEMDFSATQEFAKEDLQVAPDSVEPFSLNETLSVEAATEPSIAFNDPTVQTQVNEPAQQMSNDISIETDEFSSAIDNAFDLGASMNSAPLQSAAPTAQEFAAPQNSAQTDFDVSQMPSSMGDQPMQQNPFQGFDTPAQNGFQTPAQQINSDSASKFSLNGDGNLDVEATQEFNLNDIMSQAQDIHDNSSSQGGDNDMVSGDDVASKLDSFFG